MAKEGYVVLGTVDVPKENMKDMIWVDRKAGEVRARPFGTNALTPQEKARRAKEKEMKKKAREAAKREKAAAKAGEI